jgi:hypothetical protein
MRIKLAYSTMHRSAQLVPNIFKRIANSNTRRDDTGMPVRSRSIVEESAWAMQGVDIRDAARWRRPSTWEEAPVRN